MKLFSQLSPPAPDSLAAISDRDLLDAWTTDKHAASLAAIVDRYKVMVLSVCRRRCRNEADAEDAFQTTFLYLARNGHKIRHPERLPGWLHRVAQRAAVATLKSIHQETEPMIDPPADTTDPLDRLTQRHEAIVLDEELADLPEHYRSAIVMHLYEDHPIENLAKHFETTVGSIRGRLQRGKQLLAQRLRRRGIVPVLAFAAANVWTVSDAQASESSHAFDDAIDNGTLPDPPIDVTLLETLLAQGIRLMPTLYTTAGILGGSALIVLLAMSNTNIQGQAPGQELSFTLAEVDELETDTSVVVAQFGNPQSQPDATGNVEKKGKKLPQGENDIQVPNQGSMIWVKQVVIPPPTSAVAQRVSTALDEESEMQFSTTLAELPSVLQQKYGIPVDWDKRALTYAKQDVGQMVEIDETNLPLRSGLQRMLNPLGLKAVVQDEGLIITADMSALVHRGIGVNRWTNIDEEAELEIAARLDEESVADYSDLPLEEVMIYIAEQHQLPLVIDRRSLEEIGLSAEEPVTLHLSGVKLRSLLTVMLSDLELTYTIKGESLIITTQESADQNLLSRIYYLEGTGFPADDFDSLMNVIQTSTAPETWENLGGPSTMSPLIGSRPGLMVLTTYKVHEDLAQFFQALRETHFGQDPVLEDVQIPVTQGMQIQMGGGMGGMGGGGMGGGGMF